MFSFIMSLMLFLFAVVFSSHTVRKQELEELPEMLDVESVNPNRKKRRQLVKAYFRTVA